MNLPRVRFATPELEAADTAWRAQRREEKRRHRVAGAIRTFIFYNCKHGRTGGDCLGCAIDFFLGAGQAKVAEIDEVLALEEAERAKVFTPQLGQCWRLPVGPAAYERVCAILAAPDDLRRDYDLPPLTPEPPELDLLCAGSASLEAQDLVVLFDPLNMMTRRSHGRPCVRVPVEYLLTHGVRTS